MTSPVLDMLPEAFEAERKALQARVPSDISVALQQMFENADTYAAKLAALESALESTEMSRRQSERWFGGVRNLWNKTYDPGRFAAARAYDAHYKNPAVFERYVHALKVVLHGLDCLLTSESLDKTLLTPLTNLRHFYEINFINARLLQDRLKTTPRDEVIAYMQSLNGKPIGTAIRETTTVPAGIRQITMDAEKTLTYPTQNRIPPFPKGIRRSLSISDYTRSHWESHKFGEVIGAARLHTQQAPPLATQLSLWLEKVNALINATNAIKEGIVTKRYSGSYFGQFALFYRQHMDRARFDAARFYEARSKPAALEAMTVAIDATKGTLAHMYAIRPLYDCYNNPGPAKTWFDDMYRVIEIYLLEQLFLQRLILKCQTSYEDAVERKEAAVKQIQAHQDSFFHRMSQTEIGLEDRALTCDMQQPPALHWSLTVRACDSAFDALPPELQVEAHRPSIRQKGKKAAKT